MQLIDRLRDAVREAEDHNVRDAATKLKSASELSYNEREVLNELGTPDEWAAKLMGLGYRALKLAQDLNAPDWYSSYVVQDAVDPGDPYYGIPRRGLEIEVARQAVEAISHSCNRVQYLVWFAFHNDLSPRVTGYLERVGRCYIAGFDPEVIIVCRSILDVALRDVLSDGISDRMSLAARITAAKDRGLLTEEAVEAATAVRIRGNQAVHEEATSAQIAEDTFNKTVQVLTELFSSNTE